MNIFPGHRFYVVGVAIAILFVIAYFVPSVYWIINVLGVLFPVAIVLESFFLFKVGKVLLERTLPDRFSNGDQNEVEFRIQSQYPLPIYAVLLDELPEQFQFRDFRINLSLKSNEIKTLNYHLKPKERGEYKFGNTNVLISTFLGLVQRRQVFEAKQTVKVYPSFLNLEKYELAAISQNLKVGGTKRMRRIGQSQEFDHIKDYVLGDDPRCINWTATARKSSLMINHYVDEKSQPVYCMIDKGRAMQMPFEGMSLLDYSINASLVVSNIALKKGDRAGLITFQHKPETFIPAQRRTLQVSYLLEALYNQKTKFNETDFSSLYTYTSQKIAQRSLLLMFTNFESIYSLDRQLPYLKLINKHHFLLVVFFKNTELEDLLTAYATKPREVYDKAIVKQLMDEKAAIRNKLHLHGIMSLYTRPQNLSVDVLNKYIEIKTKRLI